MQPTIFSRFQYILLFCLLGLVYIIGLFVPLMDNDSAHHANIALRMYLTGDYVNLIDHGRDYLDKPHLHFWLAAFSYKIFGVTGFAYKLPSFLFTVLGTYSTYCLGKHLYNIEVGKIAALMVASAFAYILANNDVRMDAILTASIIFATWHLAAWVDKKTLTHAVLAALGLALGFCTKGHIAVFTPVVGICFYIAYKKNWQSFYHWQLLALVLAFCVFISPVVYCYYLQYDLHPEKIIRGKTGHSGIAFILWNQNFERFQGDSFGADAKNDYLFFIHSFLWAFAPWSIVAFIAFFNRAKNFRQHEWLTTSTFVVMALLVSFSGFKLPHYLNIIFPVTAIFTTAYLLNKFEKQQSLKGIYITQFILCSLCIILAGVINTWAFPVKNIGVIIAFLMLLLISIYFFALQRTRLQKTLAASILTSIIVFFLLNANFYFQLLQYQGGNQLAFATKEKVNAKNVYAWPGIYSSSYNFYTAELRKEFTTELMQQPSPVWILTDVNRLNEVKEKGLPILQTFEQADYEITTMQLPFINPATRQKELGRLFLVRVK